MSTLTSITEVPRPATERHDMSIYIAPVLKPRGNEPPAKKGSSVPRLMLRYSKNLFWAAALALAFLLFLPFAFGGTTLVIETGSMSPAIQAGDLIAIRPVAIEDIQLHDVITFATEENIITHRVVGFGVIGNEKTVITQGDTNNTPDKPIVSDQLRGRVMYAIPKLGYAVAWVQHNVILTVGILAGAVFVAPAAINKIKSHKTNQSCFI